MGYISLGVLGFLAGYALEAASLKDLRWARRLLSVTAALLLAYSTAMVCLYSRRFGLPSWLQAAGWGLLPVAGLLLAHSLFLELPPAVTYWAGGPQRLVTSGSYALARHPSVLWYGLLLLSLLLVSRSYLLLLATPVWLTMDIEWAVVQERWVLAPRFPEYAEYRGGTPMLLPNRRSLSAGWKWLCAASPLPFRAPQGALRERAR